MNNSSPGRGALLIFYIRSQFSNPMSPAKRVQGEMLNYFKPISQLLVPLFNLHFQGWAASCSRMTRRFSSPVFPDRFGDCEALSCQIYMNLFSPFGKGSRGPVIIDSTASGSFSFSLCGPQLLAPLTSSFPAIFSSSSHYEGGYL